jgi:hypothetical protein
LDLRYAAYDVNIILDQDESCDLISLTFVMKGDLSGHAESDFVDLLFEQQSRRTSRPSSTFSLWEPPMMPRRLFCAPKQLNVSLRGHRVQTGITITHSRLCLLCCSI